MFTGSSQWGSQLVENLAALQGGVMHIQHAIGYFKMSLRTWLFLQEKQKQLDLKFDYDSKSECHSFYSDWPGNVLLWDNWINYVYSSISRLTLLSNSGAEHWAPASLCLSLSLRLFIIAVFCPSQPPPLWHSIYSASLSR